MRQAIGVLLSVLVSAGAAQAARYHVAPGGSDGADGLGWSTAWDTLTNAIAQSADGDTVVVSNGTFTTEVEMIVDKGITIVGTNGAAATVVQRSAGYIRLFTVNHASAVLDGLTVENGRQSSNDSGGGVKIVSGTVQNCVIRNNQAISGGSYGGGAWIQSGGLLHNCEVYGNATPSKWGGGLYVQGGTVRNCLIRDNTAGPGRNFSTSGSVPYSWYGIPYLRSRGGGVYMTSGTMENCTVTRNVGLGPGEGIWMANGTVRNCIIYFNGRPDYLWDDENIYAANGSVTYSCMTPLMAGTGNTNAEPDFVDLAAADFRLLPGSPCIDSGTFLGGIADDLDGNSRPVDGDGDGVADYDMGAYEAAAANGGTFRCNAIADTNETLDALTAQFTAHAVGPDTNSLSYWWDFENDGTIDATGATASHSYAPGWYSVGLTVSNASEGCSVVKTNYIRVAPSITYVATNGNNTFPYDTWAKAATSVKAGADAAYDEGGAKVSVGPGTHLATTHTMIERGIRIESTDGPESTILARQGPAQHRLLIVLHEDAVVKGLTITNGYVAGHAAPAGGVMMAEGLLENCIITGNTAPHGSSFGGGGVYCRGGGNLRNCLITRNTCDEYGGGVYAYHNYSRIESCTIAGNTVIDAARSGGGLYSAHAGTEIVDTIVYGNTAAAGSNYAGNTTFKYSCSPGLSGNGNVSGNPNFADAAAGDYQILIGSPCIDAGSNLAWMAAATDLAGTNRIFSGTVDIGAYEYVPPATELAATNLPADPIGMTSATMRGGILHDGDAENPYVYICWDFIDRGTSSTGAWPNVLAMGTNYGMGQSFATNVTGLVSGSNYAYRCYVTNSSGAAWADPPAFFTTVHLPAITNLGAANPTKFGATLRAEVTDAGTDTPDCWFYYWMDGSASTTVVAMGEQSGVFSNTLSGLLPGSNYQYRALATNLAGAAWTGVKGFQTVAAVAYYVATNGNESADGLSWATAVASLTNALAKATEGDTIVMSNGTHGTYGEITVNEHVTIRGQTDATNTIVRRAGGSAYRVFTLDHAGAVLEELTIENGAQYPHATHGGGVQLFNGTVRDCIIRNNIAGSGGSLGGGVYIVNGLVQRCELYGNRTPSHWGGGLYQTGGIVENCLIHHNTAGVGHVFASSGSVPYSWHSQDLLSRGGGVYMAGGVMRNCTITRNVGLGPGEGLWLQGGSVSNCIVYFNGRPDYLWDDENVYLYSGTIAYSCMTPLQPGAGNTDGEPDFVDVMGGDFRLLPGSACIDAGAALADVVDDLDGNARPTDGDGNAVAALDMGAFETAAADGGVFRCNAVASTNETLDALTAQFTAYAAGPSIGGVSYEWDFENDGIVDAVGATASHAYAPGWYTVRLVASVGLDTCSVVKTNYIRVAPSVSYAATNGSGTFPYDTWAKASTDLKAAADAAYHKSGGTTVLVGQGTYNASTQILVERGITVQSVAGAEATVFERQGAAQNRLFIILHDEAVVDGLTLHNGYVAGSQAPAGGVLMGRGTLRNCIVSRNSATHGSSFGGGGVYCRGGGTVRNCLIWGNTCETDGGGIYCSGTAPSVENCTIVSNVVLDAAESGGGIYATHSAMSLVNNIVVGNSAASGADYAGNTAFLYSCAPGLSGSGNIAADPRFVDAGSGNFRLADNSPCVNAGSNLTWIAADTLDLGGEKRLRYEVADMGAYEKQPPFGSLIIVK